MKCVRDFGNMWMTQENSTLMQRKIALLFIQCTVSIIGNNLHSQYHGSRKQIDGCVTSIEIEFKGQENKRNPKAKINNQNEEMQESMILKLHIFVMKIHIT